jgi:integrase
MEACGVKGFRFHDLRHTFRTQGAEAGVPLEVMMAQLRPMDPQTSLDYVRHAVDSEQCGQAVAMEEQSRTRSSFHCGKRGLAAASPRLAPIRGV